jgi:hypothetical protein
VPWYFYITKPVALGFAQPSCPLAGLLNIGQPVNNATQPHFCVTALGKGRGIFALLPVKKAQSQSTAG